MLGKIKRYREYILQNLILQMKICFISDPDEIPNPELLENLNLKYRFFCKNFTIINLACLIHMKHLGKEPEYAKKKI